MKKFKRIIGFAIVFVAFAASITVLANSTDYVATASDVYKRQVVEGVKTNHPQKDEAAHNVAKACESNFICWIDCNKAGSWDNCTANQEMKAGEEKDMPYTVYPPQGSPMRLRIQPYGLFDGGKAISGHIDFK